MTFFTFPKSCRFRKRSDFQALKSNSQRFVGRHLCIDYRQSKGGSSKLGITASGRYGNACERNRFKRLVREAFRKMAPEFSPVEIHVIPRQLAKTARLEEIEAELKAWQNSIQIKP